MTMAMQNRIVYGKTFGLNRSAVSAACAAVVIGLSGIAGGCATGDDRRAPGRQQEPRMTQGPGATTRPATGTRAGTAEARDRQMMTSPTRRSGEMQTSTLAFPTGNRTSSAVLLEAMTPAEVRVGQSFDYQMSVTNLLESPLHGVRVVNIGDGTEEPQTLLDIGTLAPGETRQESVAATIDNVPPGGTVANCLAVQYEPALCVALTVVNPELRVVKRGPEQAVLCREIEYAYSVTNDGTGTARNVVVSDELPEGVLTRDGQRRVERTIPTLAAGQTETFTVPVKPARTGTFASAASARSEFVDAVSSDEVSTNVRQAEVALDVRAPEFEYVGREVQYVVVVTNEGDVPAENVNVDVNSTGVSASSGRQTIRRLEPGASEEFPVRVRGADRAGDLTLTAAIVTACDLDEDISDSATVPIRTISAFQIFTVDSQDPIRVGESTVYTIRVLNEGSTVDAPVNLSGELPQGMEFVQGGGATQVSGEGRNVTFAEARLNPRQEAEWTVEARATEAGQGNFTVTLSSPDLDEETVTQEPTTRFDPGGPALNTRTQREGAANVRPADENKE